MRDLPEAMYDTHGALKEFVAIRNAVFPKFSFSALFRPMPFGNHTAALDDIVTRLGESIMSLTNENEIPPVFIEYIAALKGAVEQLQLICANLHRKTLESGTYKYPTYNTDVATFRALEERYVSLGKKVNELIASQ